jgi:hypothetical protein
MLAASGAKSAADTQAQSAKDASAAQLQASEESIAAQQQAAEAAQANQQPWINAGSAALTQLGNLLGVPISPSGQYAQAATSTTGGALGGGASGGGGAGGSLYSVNNGVLSPNQQLYNSNPIYKAAWDQVASRNQQASGANWNVEDQRDAGPNALNPNILAQNRNSLNNQLTEAVRANGGDPNQLLSSLSSNGQFQPGMVYGGASGGFAGSTGQITDPNTPGAQSLQGLKNVAGWAGADPNSMGAQSRQRLSDLMGFNGADPTASLRATPGYQFALQQGLQGIENSAAARGMQLSGATLKDLNNYAQGSADQLYQQQLGDAQSIYNDQFNQANSLYNNQVSNLMQMAGLGSGAAGTASGNTVSTGANIGNTLTNTGAQIGSNIIGAGNATAAGRVGAANAIGGGLSNAAQMYQMSQLFGNNPGFGVPATDGLTDTFSPAGSAGGGLLLSQVAQ